MNPTTQPNNTQATSTGGNGQLSHNDLTAALAFATNLHEQSLPKAPTNETSTQENTQNAPEQAVAPRAEEGTPEPKTEPEGESKKEEDSEAKLELRIMDKLDSIRKELKDDQKDQIDSLRREVENALNVSNK